MVHCTNRQKHSKPLVYKSSQVYQDCTNGVPIVKNSQKTVKTAKMTIGVPIVTGLPRMYQQCTNRQKQSKQHKNDHCCTSRHMSTKIVPTVYQQCTKNSQQTFKTAKMTIGVPTVTVLPRLYQQCNNSLPIVNKNLAIANRSRVSCEHNTSRALIGLNITP